MRKSQLAWTTNQKSTVSCLAVEEIHTEGTEVADAHRERLASLAMVEDLSALFFHQTSAPSL